MLKFLKKVIRIITGKPEEIKQTHKVILTTKFVPELDEIEPLIDMIILDSFVVKVTNKGNIVACDGCGGEMHNAKIIPIVTKEDIENLKKTGYVKEFKTK